MPLRNHEEGQAFVGAKTSSQWQIVRGNETLSVRTNKPEGRVAPNRLSLVVPGPDKSLLGIPSRTVRRRPSAVGRNGRSGWGPTADAAVTVPTVGLFPFPFKKPDPSTFPVGIFYKDPTGGSRSSPSKQGLGKRRKVPVRRRPPEKKMKWSSDADPNNNVGAEGKGRPSTSVAVTDGCDGHSKPVSSRLRFRIVNQVERAKTDVLKVKSGARGKKSRLVANVRHHRVRICRNRTAAQNLLRGGSRKTAGGCIRKTIKFDTWPELLRHLHKFHQEPVCGVFLEILGRGEQEDHRSKVDHIRQALLLAQELELSVPFITDQRAPSYWATFAKQQLICNSTEVEGGVRGDGDSGEICEGGQHGKEMPRPPLPSMPINEDGPYFPADDADGPGPAVPDGGICSDVCLRDGQKTTGGGSDKCRLPVHHATVVGAIAVVQHAGNDGSSRS